MWLGNFRLTWPGWKHRLSLGGLKWNTAVPVKFILIFFFYAIPGQPAPWNLSCWSRCFDWVFVVNRVGTRITPRQNLYLYKVVALYSFVSCSSSVSVDSQGLISISELVDGELAQAGGDGHDVTQHKPAHFFPRPLTSCRRQRGQQVSKIDGRQPNCENPGLTLCKCNSKSLC